MTIHTSREEDGDFHNEVCLLETFRFCPRAVSSARRPPIDRMEAWTVLASGHSALNISAQEGSPFHQSGE